MISVLSYQYLNLIVGVVANLTMNDQWSNASDLMTDRGAYVVVRVIRESTPGPTQALFLTQH